VVCIGASDQPLNASDVRERDVHYLERHTC
jgi:hypothetical protein